MSYYQDNKVKLLKKAYDKYHNGGGKERVAKYHQKNKETIKERGKKKV